MTDADRFLAAIIADPADDYHVAIRLLLEKEWPQIKFNLPEREGRQ